LNQFLLTLNEFFFNLLGLKTIVNAILKSLIKFMEVLVLMIIVLTIFSLISLQAFKGVYSHKCIKIYDPNATNITYTDWIVNSGEYFLTLKNYF
jgi:hypothetical protein